jgi:group I intron endonuclease
VYAITHVASGRRYIGSSVNVRARVAEHLRQLHRSSHPNAYLQAAFTKYGAAAFVVAAVEVLEDRSQLVAREQAHLDEARGHLYNLGTVAAAPFTGRKWSAAHRAVRLAQMIGHEISPETRAKIAAANKGRQLTAAQKARLVAANLGKKASPETRAKMSATRTGKPSPKPTDEAYRQKISALRRGRRPSDAAKAMHQTAMQSPETRAKMRAAWERRRQRGVTHSDEHRAKIRAALAIIKATTPEWRAKSIAAIRARAAAITHCIHGHAYEADNIYLNALGRRSCRICRKQAQERRTAKRNGRLF